MMNRRTWLGMAAGAAGLAITGERLSSALGSSAPADEAALSILVYKTPTCGCCTAWGDRLEAAGFEVTYRDVAETASIRERYGIPHSLASCHTGLVEGYAVEGHVPADVIRQLVAERPRAVGIAVPGMPIGSPGMEGTPVQRYDVLLVEQNGATRVYARR
jgi:hypothetical protein